MLEGHTLARLEPDLGRPPRLDRLQADRPPAAAQGRLPRPAEAGLDGRVRVGGDDPLRRAARARRPRERLPRHRQQPDRRRRLPAPHHQRVARRLPRRADRAAAAGERRARPRRASRRCRPTSSRSPGSRRRGGSARLHAARPARAQRDRAAAQLGRPARPRTRSPARSTRPSCCGWRARSPAPRSATATSAERWLDRADNGFTAHVTSPWRWHSHLMELWEEGDEELIGRPWDELVLEALRRRPRRPRRPLRPRPRGLALGPASTRWSSRTRSARPTRCCAACSTAASTPAAPRRRSARSPTTPTTPTTPSGRRAGGWSPTRPRPSARAGRCSPASPATPPAPTTTTCRPTGWRAAPSRWPARAPGASWSCPRLTAVPRLLCSANFADCGPNRSRLQWLDGYAPASSSRRGPRAARARSPRRRQPGPSTSAVARSRCPRGWPGLPARRAPAHVRAARPPRRLPGDAGRRASAVPRSAIGRRRAILVEPRRRGARRAAQASARRATPAPSPAAEAFTGLGFDACAAPSSRTMAAWAASPYRAIGVYIGGVNRACSQPNLTASWVGEQVAAGWHLIPTYVGLQAPTSACSSCAKLSSSQGDRAGRPKRPSDAVDEAQRVGDRARQPDLLRHGGLHADLERHRGDAHLPRAWTDQLHALGYVSGVYSCGASGIADLGRADRQRLRRCPTTSGSPTGTAQQNTARPVPARRRAWAAHQRIHQYRGGHNETYGGMTINIDNNYVDGATVGAASRRRNCRRSPSGTSSPKPARCASGSAAAGPKAKPARARSSCAPTPGCRCARGPACRPGSCASPSATAPSASPAASPTPSASPSTPAARRCCGERGILKAQLLVAIPDARATRAVQLRRAR